MCCPIGLVSWVRPCSGDGRLVKPVGKFYAETLLRGGNLGKKYTKELENRGSRNGIFEASPPQNKW